MKISKNIISNKEKKGQFDFKSIILWLILLGILLIIVFKGIGLYRQQDNVFKSVIQPELNHSGEFLFTAEKVTIDSTRSTGCTPTPNAAGAYDCRPNTEIFFETSIRNDWSKMLKFYGGFIACRGTCNKKGTSCVIDSTDKGCTERIISSQNTCSVKIGDTMACDAGSYKFTKGVYFIAPAAICSVDNDEGCTKVGMTGAPEKINFNKYIRIDVS